MPTRILHSPRPIYINSLVITSDHRPPCRWYRLAQHNKQPRTQVLQTGATKTPSPVSGNAYSVTEHKRKLAALFLILITQVSKYLNASLFMYSVPFIVSPSAITSSHQSPTPTGNSRESCCSQRHDKFYTFSNSHLPSPQNISRFLEYRCILRHRYHSIWLLIELRNLFINYKN